VLVAIEFVEKHALINRKREVSSAVRWPACSLSEPLGELEMPTSNQVFDSHLETWKREQEMPWSRIRLKVEISNLLRHVGQSGLKILDAGGGNGYATIPFAQNGCQVVVADYCMNRYSIAYHQAFLRGDLQAAKEAIGATETNTIFESTARALAVDEMVKLLENQGCVIQADYGVRCMINYWGDNEHKTEPNTLAQLEELEFALSAEYPYKLLARFFQVIAQKA